MMETQTILVQLRPRKCQWSICVYVFLVKGEWRGRGEEARGDGLRVLWYGDGLSGGRRGRGARGTTGGSE